MQSYSEFQIFLYYFLCGEKITVYWYFKSGTSLGRNTYIILVTHRIIVNGSLCRYVYKPFFSSPVRHETISRRVYIHNDSIYSRVFLSHSSTRLKSASTRFHLYRNHDFYDCELLFIWHSLIISLVSQDILSATRKYLLIIFTWISTLHLFKYRFLVIKMYAQ